jgi:hypothetical protein
MLNVTFCIVVLSVFMQRIMVPAVKYASLAKKLFLFVKGFD